MKQIIVIALGIAIIIIVNQHINARIQFEQYQRCTEACYKADMLVEKYELINEDLNQ